MTTSLLKSPGLFNTAVVWIIIIIIIKENFALFEAIWMFSY